MRKTHPESGISAPRAQLQLKLQLAMDAGSAGSKNRQVYTRGPWPPFQASSSPRAHRSMSPVPAIPARVRPAAPRSSSPAPAFQFYTAGASEPRWRGAPRVPSRELCGSGSSRLARAWKGCRPPQLLAGKSLPAISYLVTSITLLHLHEV
jgi:hypothetical protein